MTASDYPINFPYGATSAPYSAAHPHRGDDHPCPAGTPLVIDGQTVGLTGATGNVTGPHLHIQEWQSGYSNTRKPQNAFKAGTVTNIDPTATQGDGSFGKFITIQNADGWNDSYCHLSEINVSVGQIIGGHMVDDNITKRVYLAAEDRDLDSEKDGQSVYDYWRGRPVTQLLDEIYKDNETFRYKANNYDEILKELNDLKALKERGKNQAPVPAPAPEPPIINDPLPPSPAPTPPPPSTPVTPPANPAGQGTLPPSLSAPVKIAIGAIVALLIALAAWIR